MAAISRQLGDTDTALATYERALQLAESVDARSEMAEISQTLSTIYEELGRSEDALRNLQLAYRTRESINDTEALKLIGILESERDLAESALLLTQSSQRQTWLIGIAVFLLIVTAQLAVFARSRSRSLATVQSHVRELELAKALLEESELRYRSLFNDAVVAKYVIDLETRRVLEANEPAIQLSSIPASGLVDLPIAYLAPEWLRESMVNLDRLGDEDLFLTVTWFDADADRRYADICFKAVAMKGKECVIVAVHDSTEEKRWQSNR